MKSNSRLLESRIYYGHFLSSNRPSLTQRAKLRVLPKKLPLFKGVTPKKNNQKKNEAQKNIFWGGKIWNTPNLPTIPPSKNWKKTQTYRTEDPMQEKGCARFHWQTLWPKDFLAISAAISFCRPSRGVRYASDVLEASHNVGPGRKKHCNLSNLSKFYLFDFHAFWNKALIS